MPRNKDDQENTEFVEDYISGVKVHATSEEIAAT